MQRSNHGSHARVGDLVEILNPQGLLTGMTGLVTDIVEYSPLGDFDDHGVHRRFLKLTCCEHRIKDCYVLIRSYRP